MSKIPAYAKCVFKGEIYDIYQWPQQLFDGSMATFECARRPDTVVVLAVMQDGRICCAAQQQPHKPPYLSLLGGRAEPGETPLEAAQRELLEESGLSSDNWLHLKTYNDFPKLDWSVHYFLARQCRQIAQQQLDAGEKVELRYCTVDEFIHEVLPNPEFREYEIKQQIYSAFNAERAAELTALLSSV